MKIKKSNRGYAVVAVMVVMAFVGCSGGGNGGGAGSGPTANRVFKDSIVSGMNYQSVSWTGENSSG